MSIPSEMGGSTPAFESASALNDRSVLIRAFRDGDEAAVVALWTECGLVRSWNDPHKDIVRKLTVQRELFLVAECDGIVCGSVMAGYDGHRGWMNYLAVAPGQQGLHIGRTLVAQVEALLLARGCPKVNLQVRSSNRAVLAFYERLGYGQDDVLSLGKRLISDE